MRQTRPALTPATLDDLASTGRRHAMAKAVLVLFLPVVRLKGPFHTGGILSEKEGFRFKEWKILDR